MIKPLLVTALAAFWQAPLVVNLEAPARPEHLRYERAIKVLSDSSGMSCVPLDATVLAHTASAAHSDLRLFHQSAGEPEAEVPYTLTESGPEPLADTAATLDHVVSQGNQVSFDLRMPARAYSEVRLKLALSNFIATATVDARERQGRDSHLGSVALYDLSERHLGRWTALLLAENTAPVLHVVLDFRTPSGQPFPNLPLNVVQGAEVPPSRLRQTRYVATVSTTKIVQQGQLSEALLRVPAHVPVERVVIDVSPQFTANFAREVTVSARADGAPLTDTEALDAGEIAHVSLPSGDPRLYPINVREDALDATMGATLARPAAVLVAIDNGKNSPLPLRSVTLEMRDRQLCFFADREGGYVLRYGDAALGPPTYDESALSVPQNVLMAQLGPEKRNPMFHVRADHRDLLRKHPEIFWLVVLLCGGMMGGTALHHVQHRRS